MNRNLKLLFWLGMFAVSLESAAAREFNGVYEGHNMDHVAFPVGGIGTGMICFEGTGAISHVSLHHVPDLFHEPCTFAAVCVMGVENGAKVLEANVPEYKKYGRLNGGMGVGGTTWGLPRFDEGRFSVRFPFARLDLHDDDLPLDVSIVAWNPFIPNDEDNSGLPVGGFEYTFRNTSKKPVEAVFSFNTRNFMYKTDAAVSSVTPFERGFVLNQEAPANERHLEGHLAIWTDDARTTVDHCWFRGGWFDPLTMAWNNVTRGELISNELRHSELALWVMAQYEGDLDYRYYAKHFVINENNNKKSQKSFSHPEPQMCFQLLVESTHITPLTTVLKNVSHRNAYF